MKSGKRFPIAVLAVRKQPVYMMDVWLGSAKNVVLLTEDISLGCIC